MDVSVQEAAKTGFEAELVLAGSALLALLRRRGLGRQEAEELVQEASLRAWRARGRFDPARPLLPWLAAIAANCRNRRGGPVPLEEEPAAPVEEPEAGLVLAEERERLCDGLGALSRVQRRVVELFYGDRLPLARIATRTGLRIGTVKSHLHRARRVLAQALERRPGR